MRVSVLIGIVFILASSVMASSQERRVAVRPLGKNEHLVFEVKYDSRSKRSVILFFRENGTGKHEEVARFPGLSCNNVYLCKNNVMAFFLIERNLDGMKTNDVWILDGINGYSEPILEANCSFVVSEDAGFICYEYPKYVKDVPWANELGKTKLGIPTIRVFDVWTKKTKEFDFSNDFLKDKWGMGTQIEYVSEKKWFGLDFYIEDQTYYRGHIGLSDLIFHIDK